MGKYEEAFVFTVDADRISRTKKTQNITVYTVLYQKCTKIHSESSLYEWRNQHV